MNTEEYTAPALNASDRCDYCNARAVAVITRDEHVNLLFCQHHTNKHRSALSEQGFTIIE